MIFNNVFILRSFGEITYSGKITVDEAEKDQNNLWKNVMEFNEKWRPRTKKGKNKKEILMQVYMLFMKGEN